MENETKVAIPELIKKEHVAAAYDFLERLKFILDQKPKPTGYSVRTYSCISTEQVISTEQAEFSLDSLIVNIEIRVSQ